MGEFNAKRLCKLRSERLFSDDQGITKVVVGNPGNLPPDQVNF
jgi:hypothetical protein